MSEFLVRLVDDDPAVLDGHGLVLRVAGFDVAGYESAEAFLEKDDPRRPGCAVLDLRMGGMSGLECQAAMASRGIDLPVLFITGHGDMETAVYALKKGAADFLSKPVTAEKLVDSCRRLSEWHLALRAHRAQVDAAAALVETLTPRERDVAKLAAEGRPNKAAALELGVSEQAVKIHRSNVYAKLGVHSPVEVNALLTLAAEAAGNSGDGSLVTLRVLG